MEDNQLWEPLYDCYQSLMACGMRIIANGSLLDILHRIRCFGVTLSQMDIVKKALAIPMPLLKLPVILALAIMDNGAKLRNNLSWCVN